MKIFFKLFLLLFFSLNSHAYEIESLNSKYENGRFTIDSKAIINAKKERVFQILTNYEELPKLSSKIIYSKIIDQNTNFTKVTSKAQSCVLFFCQKIINTQLVRVKGDQITAETVAVESDLKFGQMNWQIEEKSGKTHINYSATIELKFFVPPVIGTYFVKHLLEKEAKEILKNVERLSI